MSGYYRAPITLDGFERYLRKQFVDSQSDAMLSYIDDDQGSTPENMTSPWGRGEDAGYQQELRDILAAPLGASQNMDNVIARDCGYLEGFSKHFGQVESELWTLYDQVDGEIRQADASHLDLEREYNKNLEIVAKKSNDAFDKFKATQEKLQNATAAATRITMRLESHEAARKHADRALGIICHLKDFQSNAMQDSIFDEATEESAHDIHQLFHMSKDLRNCHDKESVEAQKLKEVAAKIETKYNQMQKALKKGLDKAHAESNSTEMVRCAHLLVNYFNADDCYTHYVKNNCAVIKAPGGGYDKHQEDIQWGAKEPQEAFDTHIRDAIFTGSASFDAEYQLIKRIFPDPAQVMKKLVEYLFNNRIAKFIQAIKDACNDPTIMGDLSPEKQGLEVTAVAFASMQQIELKLQQYNLADLDVHALTLKLFPELKGVAAGSTGEQDYIDREMACLQEVLTGHQQAAINREKNIAEESGDLSAFKTENEVSWSICILFKLQLCA
jgi:hypothetical protein